MIPNFLKIVFASLTVAGDVFLGILVLIRNPKSRINILFYGISLLYGGWTLCLLLYEIPVMASSLFWIKITFLIATVEEVVILAFSFIFPIPIFRRIWKFAILYSLLFIILSCWMLFFTHIWIVRVVIDPVRGLQTVLGGGYYIWLFMIWILVMWILMNFLRNYQRVKGIQKMQIRYLLYGFIMVAVIATVLDGLVPIFFKDTRFFLLSMIAPLFFNLIVAYIIIKHRFMDIRLIVTRSVSYFLLIITLGYFYAGGLFIFGSFITKSEISSINLVLSTLLALVIAFTFQPILRFFEKVTNRVFYKDHYEVDQILGEFSEAMVSSLELNELADKILNILHEKMMVSHTSLIILGGKGQKSHFMEIEGQTQFSNIQIKLLKMLGKTGSPLIFEELNEGKIKKIMRDNNIYVFVPLKTEDNMAGYLLLGEKSSGDIYYDQDLRVLEILAPELVVALSNAHAYQEIKELNRTLEKRVKKRTAQLELTQAEEIAKAKELLRLKDEFVFIATHDLRTPVTAITGFVYLLNKTKESLPEGSKENLGAIEEAIERLNQLVDDLLEVARSESGTIKVDVTKVDAVSVIENSIREIEPSAKEKGITIKRDLETDNNRFVMANQEKLAEVMENLLSNAIKFNKEDGEIKVISVKENDNLKVIVADTGYGIPGNEHSKVFSKFFKYRNDNTLGITGTGLGLFVARMLVEKMKGKISFTSKEGAGTAFTFTLPSS